MNKKKSLLIVKYNKEIQNRLNIATKDYKEYCQIEIELKLVNNKYNKFINISEKDEEYYHIYFNNSKEEIKRNYLKEKEKVNTIKIIIDYQAKSLKKLFFYCDNISSIYFKKFNSSNIIDMSSMFEECSSLKELNISNFNTNNVTDMSDMFKECKLLTELNISNFNINPLAAPYAEAPALKYGDVNTETTSPSEAKGLITQLI